MTIAVQWDLTKGQASFLFNVRFNRNKRIGAFMWCGWVYGFTITEDKDGVS